MQYVIIRAKEKSEFPCRARREQGSFPSHPLTPGPSISPVLSQSLIPCLPDVLTSITLRADTKTIMSYSCFSVFPFLDPTLKQSQASFYLIGNNTFTWLTNQNLIKSMRQGSCGY